MDAVLGDGVRDGGAGAYRNAVCVVVGDDVVRADLVVFSATRDVDAAV